jgi:hypothetical protein
MKKVSVLISLIFISTLFCQSQFFVGGSISLDGQGGKTEFNDNTDKLNSSFIFNLSPQLGFQISEKMDVGAYLSYGYHHSNSHQDPALIANATSMGFRPYLRYYAFTLNKFSVFGEAALLFGYSLSKSHQGNTDYDDVKNVNIGLNAYPGMAYKINERIELNALISLFSLGVNQNFNKTGDIKDSNFGFHFGVDMQYILTTGSISVGAIYRFK